MAPKIRNKILVCFYCGEKSGIKYDGLITHWDCGNCEAENYLDENGEITDPPVATTAAFPAPGDRTYAIPRNDPSSSSAPGDSPFCATCLNNQHLYRASLAQFDVETDPDHPDFRDREKKYYKYKVTIEKLYPQVCQDCQPSVMERMKAAMKVAQSDFLGRKLSKSREQRKLNANAPLIKYPNYGTTGQWAWYGGLFGTLLWNVCCLLGGFQDRLPPIPAILDHPNMQPTMDFALPLLSKVTSNTFAWSMLLCTIFAVLWNPYFEPTSRGFRFHIKGTSNWYKFQLIIIFTRGFLCYIMGTNVLSNSNAEATLAAHAMSCLFNVYLAVAAHRSIWIDMTPLWSTPTKFPHVGIGLGSPSPEGHNTMINALYNIEDSTGTPRPASPPSPATWSNSPVPSGYKNRVPSTYNAPASSVYGTSMSTPHVNLISGLSISRSRQPFSVNKSSKSYGNGLTDPSIPDNSYGQTPIPSQQYHEDAGAMDWSPTANNQSQHRAFKPSTRGESSKLFGESPITDQPSAFWYKVPPAPITPAHRMRNPPNPSRLRVSSQETKQNFFNNVTRKNSDPDVGFGGMSLNVDAQPRQNVEFAQPKFFPPTTEDDSTKDLVNAFMSTFTLSNEEQADPKAVSRHESRRLNTYQALALALGFLLWKIAYALTELEYLKALGLSGAILVALRNIKENWFLEDRFTFRRGAETLFGVLELSATSYGIVQIWWRGNSECLNCESLGSILLAAMFVHQVCLAAFK
ncbi:Ima1 N-terminal domain-containing protein [Amylocarpus encephaloides]|uniref:Ima1 N-terminal domain-containing protein n=1 Tax=Amylocarpus encephaloides TaxID=45428 RepID=A0A9P7YRJ1_9HELO|nr:Ima1 N-terminal domain-containing protein [Amylocarpus encephaloides]